LSTLKEIRALVAEQYTARREAAEAAAEQTVARVWSVHPELAALEKKIGIAGAELLGASASGTGLVEAQARLTSLREDKARLLTKLGVDPDYNRPRFSCAQCEDTGYSSGVRCACYHSHLEPYLRVYYHLDGLSDMTFANFDESVFNPLVEEGGKSSQRDYMARLRDVMSQWVDDFVRARKTGKSADLPDNLLFVGPTGTGKTWLAGSVANALLAQNIIVFYQTAPQILSLTRNYHKLKATFSPDPDELEEAEWLYDTLLTADLLIVDDLGTEHATPGERLSEWLNLINARASAERRTLISTNLDLTALHSMYDERLMSRLLGNFRLIPFWGKDVRLARFVGDQMMAGGK
jgi:DNA replication protein DnaC